MTTNLAQLYLLKEKQIVLIGVIFAIGLLRCLCPTIYLPSLQEMTEVVSQTTSIFLVPEQLTNTQQVIPGYPGMILNTVA